MSIPVAPYRWTNVTGNGLWSDPDNWDQDGSPGLPGLDAVVVMSAPGSPTATYDATGPGYKSVTVQSDYPWQYPGYPVFTLMQVGYDFATVFLTLGETAGNAGALTQASGTLSVTGTALIGDAGIGTFNQSGGVASIGLLVLGSQSGGQGTVLLTGGELDDNAIVGDGGTGNFTNAGALHEVTGNLILGNQSGGVGIYTITGNGVTDILTALNGNGAADPVGSNGIEYVWDDNGNLISQSPRPAPNGALIVGQFGDGAFTQGSEDQSDTGNIVHVAGDLVLGNQSGSVGQYTLNTGSLGVDGKMVIGSAGGGVNIKHDLFTQNGGTVTVTGDAASDPDYLGVGGSSFTGAVLVGGGVDDPGDGTGEYVLNDGVLQTFILGVGHSGIGTFTQNGGAVELSYALWLGNRGSIPNSDGFYSLFAGTLTASNITVGFFGRGTVNQSGGSATVNGMLDIANGPTQPLGPNNMPTRSGIYNLSAGLLTVQEAIVGNGGVGTVEHTGGLLTIGTGYDGQVLANGLTSVTHSGNLIVGAQAGSIGTYDLGETGQANTTQWAGYPDFSPDTPPPAFDDAGNAPFVQVFGNIVIGRVTAGLDVFGEPHPAASGTFNLAGDGSTLRPGIPQAAASLSGITGPASSPSLTTAASSSMAISCSGSTPAATAATRWKTAPR
jgi:hypothetical protein